jgi:hypothetical protein
MWVSQLFNLKNDTIEKPKPGNSPGYRETGTRLTTLRQIIVVVVVA